MQQRDSVFYTVGVAAVLCVVCSLAVSFAAVQLRPLQEENKKLDRQRNILDAAGLSMGEFGKTASELTRGQKKSHVFTSFVNRVKTRFDKSCCLSMARDCGRLCMVTWHSRVIWKRSKV